jgi:lipopolysaccharide/colanic/teichoic acid biosynthesis glycosyltransferase
LLLTCIILRVTGEGEVFYKQKRVGQYRKPIEIIKFATMLKNSPNIGTGTVTLRNDPRVLPVGRFLRKSKINELPQIFNVLLGDMSLIGPRPQTQRCFEAFPDSLQDQIASVKPGLSGIGSIFFRNEELMLSHSDNAIFLYDNVIMPHKGELEVWFVENNSLKIYFALIIATVIVVLFDKIPFQKSIFKAIPKSSDIKLY